MSHIVALSNSPASRWIDRDDKDDNTIKFNPTFVI
jgi:hypothetical protein